ncbi:MAG: hypothetical protein KJ737_16940 [Proteobacteria bacterium]|nr:hypothetical protein [Pseudomonadota bacterium]
MKTSANKIIILIGCLLVRIAWAQDIDENALFSSDNTLMESSKSLEEDVGQIFEKEGVSFSGRLIARGVYSISREYLRDGGFDTNQLINTSEGDFFVDVRLKNGVKGFVNYAIENMAQDNGSFTTPYNGMTPDADPAEDTSEFQMEDTTKEFFIDANANRKVYFRIGKQVLKWGRTYFWNPTDFINIEKRNFLDMNRYREGVYGTKIQIPFGSQKNLYAFINFTSSDNLNDTGYALKYEFLINSTELSFSSWRKNDTGYAWGFDVSTNLMGFDLNSEVSLYHQYNHLFIEVDGDKADLINEKDEESVRLSFGITRTFDYEINDQISLTYEFFYNENGYDENIFDNMNAVILLIANDLYEPNTHGKYYSALFGSIYKYPTPDMTLTMSILSNLSDGSAIIVPGFTYEPVDHFTLAFNMNCFTGPEKAEYTIQGSAMAWDLSVELEF